MLYPIELLGHVGGSMLASLGAFVMLVPLHQITASNGELRQHISHLAVCMTSNLAILQSALSIFDKHPYVFDL